MSDPARDEEVDDLYRRLEAFALVLRERDELRAQVEEVTAERDRLRAVLVPSDENVEALACLLAQGHGLIRPQESQRKCARTMFAFLAERAGIKP